MKKRTGLVAVMLVSLIARADEWDDRRYENRQVENRQLEQQQANTQYANQRYEVQRVNKAIEQSESEDRAIRYARQQEQAQASQKALQDSMRKSPRVPATTRSCAPLEFGEQQYLDARDTGYFVDGNGQPYFRTVEYLGADVHGSIVTVVRLVNGVVPTKGRPQPAEVTLTLSGPNGDIVYKSTSGLVSMPVAIRNTAKGFAEINMTNLVLEPTSGGGCLAASGVVTVAAWVH